MAESSSLADEEGQILALFRRFDGAGSGTLAEEQLRAILAALDPAAFTEGVVSELLRRIDSTAGGQVNYEAFLRLIWQSDAAPSVPTPPVVEERPEPIPVHGVLVVGRRGSGKTSLVLSLLAQVTGAFPSRKDAEIQLKRSTMVETGHRYELPVSEHETKPNRRTVVIDTAPYSNGLRSERTLRTGDQQTNSLPSWLSDVLSAHSLETRVVILTIDGTDTPLWEDDTHCAGLAAFIAVLRRERIGVAVAVTKLARQRDIALQDANHGKNHGGQVGRDPRSDYETFVSRYLEKVGVALRAKLSRMGEAAEESVPQPPFLRVDKTIFDVPTWVGVDDFRSWQSKRGTSTAPNFNYCISRLRRLLRAVAEQATETEPGGSARL